MNELAKGKSSSDPLDLGFNRLWQEMDRFFSRAMNIIAETVRTSGNQLALGYLLPKVEVERQGEEIVASVAVPGVRPDSLEVSVSTDYLTVRGEAETRDGHSQCYRSFYRTIPLPARVRPEAARTEQHGTGRLVVRVPVA
ncbi:MAG: Hsp20/alpha crystallin family protein [Betaproteobacteria bacterium]